MKKLSIPHITDEELIRRYLKIKPIAEVAEVKYWLRDYSLEELRTLSYLWNIVPDKREPVGEALSTHTRYEFQCLHTLGYHSVFRPSIAEVLAQIPEDVLENYFIDAFEIIGTPTSNGGFRSYKKALDMGFHISIVRLYIRVKDETTN